MKIFCQKFRPFEFEDFAENLVKLKQTGTLWDYILDFCRLSNRTKDISLTLLKSYFIGGLKAELRYDVKLLKPKDVLEAFAFAQQIDANLLDLKVKSWHKSPIIQPSFQSLVLENATNQAMVDNRPKFNNVRRLTPEEVDHYRTNRLCFHYKEKYVRGHSCEDKQLLLIDVQDVQNPEIAEVENEAWKMKN